MGELVIKAAENKRREIVRVNRAAIHGGVKTTLKNFNELRGSIAERKVLYRQVSEQSYLCNLFVLFVSLSYPNLRRGEILLDEVASWRGWRNALDKTVFIRRRDFLTVENNLAVLRNERARALYMSDLESSYNLTLEIMKCEREMLDAIRFSADGMVFKPEF